MKAEVNSSTGDLYEFYAQFIPNLPSSRMAETLRFGLVLSKQKRELFVEIDNEVQRWIRNTIKIFASGIKNR